MFSRFQGAHPDHMRVKSLSCCFPREVVSSVCPGELVNFDPYVAHAPPFENPLFCFLLFSLYYRVCLTQHVGQRNLTMKIYVSECYYSHRTVFNWVSLNQNQANYLAVWVLCQTQTMVKLKPKLTAGLASYADVLRLVTRSSPRTSAQRTGHFRSLAVSLCFKRTNPLFC